jgi:hypothetical protein
LSGVLAAAAKRFATAPAPAPAPAPTYQVGLVWYARYSPTWLSAARAAATRAPRSLIPDLASRRGREPLEVSAAGRRMSGRPRHRCRRGRRRRPRRHGRVGVEAADQRLRGDQDEHDDVAARVPQLDEVTEIPLVVTRLAAVIWTARGCSPPEPEVDEPLCVLRVCHRGVLALVRNLRDGRRAHARAGRARSTGTCRRRGRGWSPSMFLPLIYPLFRVFI